MEHTQGPWKWLDYPDGRKLLVAPSRAVIHCSDAPIGIEPADQNIIAAAPTLLKAVRLALAEFERISYQKQADPQVIRLLNAAVQRAEGQPVT